MFCFSRNKTFNLSDAEDVEDGMLREKDDRVTGIRLKPLLYPAPTSHLPHPLSLQIREAIEMRDLQAVAELLAATDLLASDWDETPLHMCIFYYCDETEAETITPREMDIINVILVKHPGILDHEDCSGSTALHRAILSGHLEVVQTLLDSGATSHIGDITALHVAVRHPHILKFFLDKDDVENFHNKTGCAPIHNAAVYDKVESVELLVDKFGEEQLMWKSDGATLLHVAAQHGSVAVAKFLLSSPQRRHRSNINLKDSDGKTPLYLAAEHGHREVTALLFRNGAVLSEKVKNGKQGKRVVKQIEEKISDPKTFLEGLFDGFIYEKTDRRGRPKICVDYRVLTDNDGNGLGQMKVLQDLVVCNLRNLLQHPLPRSLLYLKMKLLMPVFYFLIAVYAIFLVAFNIYIFRFIKKGARTAMCTNAGTCMEYYAYAVVMALIYSGTFLLLALDGIVIRAQGIRYFCSCEYYIPLFGYMSLLPLLAAEAFRPLCSQRDFVEYDSAIAALGLAWLRAWTLLVRLPNCGYVVYVLVKVVAFFIKFATTASMLVFILTIDITLFYSLKSNSTTNDNLNTTQPPTPTNLPTQPLFEFLGYLPGTFENIKISLGLTNDGVKNSDLDYILAHLCLVIITLVVFMAMLWIYFTLYSCELDDNPGTLGSLEHQLDLVCTLDLLVRTALGKICKRLLMRRRHYCQIENYGPSDKTWKVSFNVDDNSATPFVYNDTLDKKLRKLIIKKVRDCEHNHEKTEAKNEKRDKIQALYDVVVGSTLNNSQAEGRLRITKIDDKVEPEVTLKEKVNTLEIETKGIKESIDYIKVCVKMLQIQSSEKNKPKSRKRSRSMH